MNYSARPRNRDERIIARLQTLASKIEDLQNGEGGSGQQELLDDLRAAKAAVLHALRFAEREVLNGHEP
jgi:hypothetical protein